MSENQDQRNHDFSKGMTDAQFAYIEAERRVAELKDENKRLRSCLSDDAENAKLIMGENARLRELVRDMLRWMPCHRPCSRCERYKYPIGCEFERRRLELGIEVVE